ncbi:hypothetical protein J7T55_004456 [Diaporthe amygdali]|uniref:uncharacterized protein n=1 Tax=Phomopsis amygdali TaxID=1214568 RepID=UPI0022FE58EE|nr:uncharacterized protein J7T55_004456 [Diaporthe amygdali]KAJ0109906.1 hypothetical protein J7T55_004456 [Diaporthe amygdali]
MSYPTNNTYRRYKQDTESLFTWLSDSLDKLGIAFDEKIEEISIRRLLELASQAHSAGVSMPYEVIFSVEDALKVRRQYHAWYSNHLSEDSSQDHHKRVDQSNKAHAAFIDVLQYIHDLFAPAKNPAPQSLQSSPTDKKILDITNLFANLGAETEAEVQDPYPGANLPSGTKLAVNPSVVVRRVRALTEDRLLELYCLLEDANKIRHYLRKKWAEYSTRKVDLQTAAVTTQMALESFLDIEDAFERKHGKVHEDEASEFDSEYRNIYMDLAFGDLAPCLMESTETMSKKEKTAAIMRAQDIAKERCRKMEASAWHVSDDLRNWNFQPAYYALRHMLAKGDEWVLKQSCRTPADRSDDLDAAMGFSRDKDRMHQIKFHTAAREFMDTCVDVYAVSLFFRQDQTACATADIITLMWAGPCDYSIGMVLYIQISHDIRTAKTESGQANIITQASDDYKKLGCELAGFSRRFFNPLQRSSKAFENLKASIKLEQAWLEAKIPEGIGQLNNRRKKAVSTLSNFPLLVNPVLAGMFLFEQSYKRYRSRICMVNCKWSLVPFAHTMNWLAVADQNTTADFRKIWPDFYTTLGMIGPRPAWMGSGPPETLRNCRNRMLLAWGLPLTEFYQRMINGDIPRVEELIRRIAYNKTDRLSTELIETMLGGDLSMRENPKNFQKVLREARKYTGQLLKIEFNQPVPLLEAVHENVNSQERINAKQSQIRKIVLSSTTVYGSGTTAKTPISKPKGHQEPDMLSYIDTFSRTVKAEMPRIMFPYDELSSICCDLACILLDGAHEAATTDLFDKASEGEGRDLFDKEDIEGCGAYSVCSMIALATMFRERNEGGKKCSLEEFLLKLLDEQWKKSQHPKDELTRDFVEKCKGFGFLVPECATEALSSGEPPGAST